MSQNSAPLAGDKPAHDDRRDAQRDAIAEKSRLAQRTHLLVPGQTRLHKCRIADTSATGYRVVLLTPNLDAAKMFFKQHQELVLDHIDGWQREVSVRWIKGNQLGLKILNPITRVILTDDAGKPVPHRATLLGTHGELYRITMEGPPVMFGLFTLELPNGEHLPVRVRWTLEDEICLQRMEKHRRL